jgi:hypothetical protein
MENEMAIRESLADRFDVGVTKRISIWPMPLYCRAISVQIRADSGGFGRIRVERGAMARRGSMTITKTKAITKRRPGAAPMAMQAVMQAEGR